MTEHGDGNQGGPINDGSNDQNDWDSQVQSLRYSDEDRERLIQDKKLTREKLINMIISNNKSYEKLSSEKDDVTDERDTLDAKHTKLVDTLLKTNRKLQEEEDYSKTLNDRIDTLEAAGGKDKIPTIVIVSDHSADPIIKHADDGKCRWLLVNVGRMLDFDKFWKDGGNKELITCADTVVLMLGREDIFKGAQGWSLLSILPNVVQSIEDRGIPVFVSQILPSKTRKFKTEVNVINRKVVKSASGFSGINLTEAFEERDDCEIFDDKSDNGLTNDVMIAVTKIIKKTVGVPEKREVNNNDAADDQVKITELVLIDPRYKGPLIGRNGEHIREMEADTSTVMKSIEYRYNDTDEKIKHGILITGTRPEVLQAKINTADFLATLKDGGDDDDSSKSDKRKANQGWPGPRKRTNWK